MRTQGLFLLIIFSSLVACGGSGSSSGGGGQSAESPEELSLSFSDAPISLTVPSARFAADLAYDEHDRNVFDIFLPDSDTPTPLIIFVHGGGFTSGDKSAAYGGRAADIDLVLQAGVAFASVNYRLLETVDAEGVIKPLGDVQRALQFIRYHADTLNIDPASVAMYGNSAGAGASLWLAFHDDMADSSSADLIARQSTRLKAAGALETQATYDIYRWESDVFVDYGLTIAAIQAASPELEQRLLSFYGLNSAEQLQSDETIAYRARVDMLALMSVDDPSFWIENSKQDLVFPVNTALLFHHAYHARELKERADFIGLPHVSFIPELGVADPSGETVISFLLRHIR